MEVNKLYVGNNIEVLKTFPDNCIDSIITDPPYGLTSIVKRFGKDDSAPAKFGSDGAFARASKGFMGQCYSDDTEILTEDGWFLLSKVVDDKYKGRFYSLNPDTNEIELVRAVDWQKYDYNNDMYHFSGRSVDLLVTNNHKLYIQKQNKKFEFCRADETPQSFSLSCTGNYVGLYNDTTAIGNKKYNSRWFMRFLGMYLGDGCVVHRKNQPEKQNFISIAAKKERKNKFATECLTELGVKHTNHRKQVLVYDKALEEYLSPLGKSYEKYIPNELFNYSKDLLEQLLLGLLSTDGYISNKTIQYYTTSKRLADDVQRLLFLCGYSSTLSERDRTEEHFTKSKRISYVISVLGKNKTFLFEKTDHKSKKKRLNLVKYDGKVYDVTLEKNHILLVRRNGKPVWSSNSWDGSGIEYNIELWSECLRVAKPGAILLAFGGTRTWYRIATAIEDAGWEIRDSIAWIYGCLSEDTEILTSDGWEHYHKNLDKSQIVCYNIEKDSFELHKPERKFFYENKHPAYRIKSDTTDQLVSRNHRVIVEREGKLIFLPAEELKDMERVPTLQSNFSILQKGLPKYTTTLATVEKIEYSGNVWCVQVPTGAFVARRNGMVFITGNSGFPKAFDIAKGIDKRLGVEREVTGTRITHDIRGNNLMRERVNLEGVKTFEYSETVATSEQAKLWDGWKTALKPSFEPIIVAQKPLYKSNVDNALEYGVCGFNIDGSRIETDEILSAEYNQPSGSGIYNWNKENTTIEKTGKVNTKGRYPANTILGCYCDSDVHNDDCPIRIMDRQSDEASRFFYCAKASKSERNEGLEHLAKVQKIYNGKSEKSSEDMKGVEARFTAQPQANFHPTVKPIKLMEYLCNLTKTPMPNGGIVLDPFAGSGSTLVAAIKSGREFVGIELSPEYAEIANGRILHELAQPRLF